MLKLQKSLIVPLLLVSYEIATYLSNDMYLPALPDMMRDLGLTLQQAQLTLTTWFLGSASMPLMIGMISDRYGRRSVLLFGGVIYILATITCALATNVTTLLMARFVQGGMVASMLVPGYACIHELFEQKEAIRTLAVMNSISILAPALGPLFGSIVLYFSTWRGIFWTIVIWAFISIVLLIKWMPETLPAHKRQPIHFGRLFRHYWKVLINKKFMSLMFVLGFIFSGWIAWITAGPLLVIENFHYSAIAFGIIQAIVFSVYIVGTHSVKYLLDKWGVEKLIRIGIAITLCGGIMGVGLAMLFPTSFFAFLIGMLVYSFGSALCFSPLNRTIIETSEEPMGIRVALFSVFITGFAALGSGMASVFFNGSVLSLACLVAASAILSYAAKINVS